MTKQTAPVPDRYLAANRDLLGATPMQVYEACVPLTDQGLIVIPNCHLLDFGGAAPHPFSGPRRSSPRPGSRSPSGSVDHRVAAMDIKNEPRQATVGGRVLKPTWGTGDETDFATMYTAVGPHPRDQPGPAHHLRRPELRRGPDRRGPPSGRAPYVAEMTKAGGYILGDGLAPFWIGEFGNDTGSLAGLADGV